MGLWDFVGRLAKDAQRDADTEEAEKQGVSVVLYRAALQIQRHYRKRHGKKLDQKAKEERRLAAHRKLHRAVDSSDPAEWAVSLREARLYGRESDVLVNRLNPDKSWVRWAVQPSAKEKELLRAEKRGLPTRVQYSITETPDEALGVLGVGVSATFNMMSRFSRAFTLMGATMLLPLLLMFYFAQERASAEESASSNGLLYLSWFTLAGFQGQLKADPSTGYYLFGTFETQEEAEDGKAFVLFVCLLMNFAAVITFYSAIGAFLRFIEKTEELTDLATHTVDDYAVHVSGLPRTMATEEMAAALADFLTSQIEQDVQNLCDGSDGLDSQSHRVVEVVLATDAAAVLEKLMGRVDLSIDVDRRAANLAVAVKHGKGVEAAELSLAVARSSLRKQDAQVTDFWDSESFEAVGAYVTLSTGEALASLLNRQPINFLTRLFQAPENKFEWEGQRYSLIIKNAPKPTDILWENLQYGPTNRTLRQCWTFFIVLVALLASIILASSASAFTSSLPPNLDEILSGPAGAGNLNCSDIFYGVPPTDPTCAEELAEYGQTDFILNDVLSLADEPPEHSFDYACIQNAVADLITEDATVCSEYMAQTSSGFIFSPALKNSSFSYDPATESIAYDDHGMCGGLACYQWYCSTKAGEILLKQGPNADFGFCSTFLTGSLQKYSLTYAVVMVTPLINTLLQLLVRALAPFEKHHSTSEKEKNIAFRVFVAQVINTLVIAILTFATLEDPDWQAAAENIPFFLSGLYTDFTRAWYEDVGVSLTLTMAINAVVMPISILMTNVATWFAQRVGRGSITMQWDLNQTEVKPVFDFPVIYGHVLNAVFISVVMGAGMPLLYPICAFNLTFTYWCGKISLLRFSRSPPEYNASLPKMAISVMQYAAFFHVAFGVWFYAQVPGLSISYFYPDFQDYEDLVRDTPGYGGDQFDLAKKILEIPSLLCFLIVVLWIVMSIIRTYFRVLWSAIVTTLCACLAEEEEAEEGLPPFPAAVATQNLRWVGLRSYSMTSNKEYRKFTANPPSRKLRTDDDEVQDKMNTKLMGTFEWLYKLMTGNLNLSEDEVRSKLDATHGSALNKLKDMAKKKGIEVDDVAESVWLAKLDKTKEFQVVYTDMTYTAYGKFVTPPGGEQEWQDVSRADGGREFSMTDPETRRLQGLAADEAAEKRKKTSLLERMTALAKLDEKKRELVVQGLDTEPEPKPDPEPDAAAEQPEEDVEAVTPRRLFESSTEVEAGDAAEEDVDVDVEVEVAAEESAAAEEEVA